MRQTQRSFVKSSTWDGKLFEIGACFKAPIGSTSTGATNAAAGTAAVQTAEAEQPSSVLYRITGH